jgi:hypothetical protein
VAEPPNETVKLMLRGERAHEGIELDSLEHFIDKFRAALRDFERSASARLSEVKRGGHPDARTIAATSFRLVGYHIGSAELELADVSPASNDDQLFAGVPSIATQNLSALLDSVDRGELAPTVVESLDDARRALGDDGTFSVWVVRRPHETHITPQAIARLREATHEAPAPRLVTVYGKLHLIATEGPKPRVEIRATDNYNWTCLYDDDLREKVLPLIDKRVWARGLGTRDKPQRGTLDLTDIGPLPEAKATPLFSYAPVPTDELERAQGLSGPQGIDAVSLGTEPSDESDDDLDRFLSVMLES